MREVRKRVVAVVDVVMPAYRPKRRERLQRARGRGLQPMKPDFNRQASVSHSGSSDWLSMLCLAELFQRRDFLKRRRVPQPQFELPECLSHQGPSIR